MSLFSYGFTSTKRTVVEENYIEHEVISGLVDVDEKHLDIVDTRYNSKKSDTLIKNSIICSANIPKDTKNRLILPYKDLQWEVNTQILKCRIETTTVDIPFTWEEIKHENDRLYWRFISSPPGIVSIDNVINCYWGKYFYLRRTEYKKRYESIDTDNFSFHGYTSEDGPYQVSSVYNDKDGSEDGESQEEDDYIDYKYFDYYSDSENEPRIHAQRDLHRKTSRKARALALSSFIKKYITKNSIKTEVEIDYSILNLPPSLIPKAKKMIKKMVIKNRSKISNRTRRIRWIV